MVNRASLMWRCRRGIREMDILLQQFVKKEYDTLTPGQKTDLEHLLAYQDLDILEWITGQSKPETESMQNLVKRIRRANDISD